MGLFDCPECKIEFCTNDHQSPHQVNDVVDNTFCSAACSERYTVKNLESIKKNYQTQDELKELAKALKSEGVSDADIQKIYIPQKVEKSMHNIYKYLAIDLLKNDQAHVLGLKVLDFNSSVIDEKELFNIPALVSVLLQTIYSERSFIRLFEKLSTSQEVQHIRNIELIVNKENWIVGQNCYQFKDITEISEEKYNEITKNKSNEVFHLNGFKLNDYRIEVIERKFNQSFSKKIMQDMVEKFQAVAFNLDMKHLDLSDSDVAIAAAALQQYKFGSHLIETSRNKTTRHGFEVTERVMQLTLEYKNARWEAKTTTSSDDKQIFIDVLDLNFYKGDTLLTPPDSSKIFKALSYEINQILTDIYKNTF